MSGHRQQRVARAMEKERQSKAAFETVMRILKESLAAAKASCAGCGALEGEPHQSHCTTTAVGGSK